MQWRADNKTVVVPARDRRSTAIASTTMVLSSVVLAMDRKSIELVQIYRQLDFNSRCNGADNKTVVVPARDRRSTESVQL